MSSLERIDALCTDYDRTLTDVSLAPVPEALQALQAARAIGKRIVVVSGRDLDFLHREVGHVADAIVAENGCFLHAAGVTQRLGPEVDLHTALAEVVIPLERGKAFASAELAYETELREALDRAGVQADLVRNRDRVMVLPRGVDKAMGALAALAALDILPERAAAAGDGENDLPMLSSVGHAIAVANAVPELKDLADEVTEEPGGLGLARWIHDRWLGATRTKNKEAYA